MPESSRAAQACGHFPNEQAALKRLYLATIALDPTGRGRQRWNNRWKSALNEFDVLFDGRLTAVSWSTRPAPNSSPPLTRRVDRLVATGDRLFCAAAGDGVLLLVVDRWHRGA
ncbi:hypothetical protein [Streptomyces sp. NPDC001292]|uniref:hypothetical protein n=1 Tax=Streptomyces sp. NPDC001292 TaxID=3364558 RepID=UPI0036BD5D3E